MRALRPAAGASYGPRPVRGQPRSGGSDEDVLKLPEQGRLRLGADDLLDDLTVLEHCQRRDVQDPVGPHDLGVVVYIELDDVDLAGVLSSDLLEYRGNHSARTAPLRPVVDQYGLGALQHL